MTSLIGLVPLLCWGCGLLAQSVNDLNSLVLQARRYAAHETAGQPTALPLDLYRIVGDSGGPSQELMRDGADIQQWTLTFQLQPPGSASPCDRVLAPPAAPAHGSPQSVDIHCLHGMFKDMVWSTLPIFDCKCMEWAWFSTGLDTAVAVLRASGFTRGFTTVTLLRPLYWRYPDECTYVFKCQPDQAYVGISAETGRWLWTEKF